MSNRYELIKNDELNSLYADFESNGWNEISQVLNIFRIRHLIHKKQWVQLYKYYFILINSRATNIPSSELLNVLLINC